MHTHRAAIRAALEWLLRAQDKAGDGGVSAWYSFIHGWQPSYIETTGYIINTFFDCADHFNDTNLYDRALQMADFLVEMQHSTGGYRGVVPSRSSRSKPVIFNTGQDLLGMTDAYTRTKKKKYFSSLTKAADFLVSVQEPDGSWIKYNYGHKNHVYDTRVAWSLLKVAAIYKQLKRPRKNKKYTQAALRNLDWALSYQLNNGWFSNNELPLPNIQLPYTHTISYALEGFLWSGLLLKRKRYLNAAVKGSLPIAEYYLKHTFVPGTFDSEWQSKDRYTCLTGDAQLSLVWLELYKYTKNRMFLKAAKQMNSYLKSVQNISTWNTNVRGALAGSWPIWGDLLRNRGYCRLAYPNWATKFFIDALLAEHKLKNRSHDKGIRKRR